MRRDVQIEVDVHEKHTRFSTSEWKMCVDRLLTSDQLTDVFARFAEDPDIWDEQGKEFRMSVVLWNVKQVVDKASVLEWEHKPIYIIVKSVACGTKIYEMENAMSVGEAADAAKRVWHEQFPYGERATIISAKRATPKDMKKAVEIKESK